MTRRNKYHIGTLLPDAAAAFGELDEAGLAPAHIRRTSESERPATLEEIKAALAALEARKKTSSKVRAPKKASSKPYAVGTWLPDAASIKVMEVPPRG